jgi:hypothetical protein
MAFGPKEIGRWFGSELRSQVFSYFAAPAVTAVLVFIIAHARGAPLGIAIIAGATMGMLALYVLDRRRRLSVADKLVLVGAHVERAMHDSGMQGYGIAANFTNHANVPIDFQVTRANSHLGQQVGIPDTPLPKGEFERNDGGEVMIGLVLVPPIPNARIRGEFDIDISWGTKGRLKHHRRFRRWLGVTTDAEGEVAQVLVYLRQVE